MNSRLMSRRAIDAVDRNQKLKVPYAREESALLSHNTSIVTLNGKDNRLWRLKKQNGIRLKG